MPDFERMPLEPGSVIPLRETLEVRLAALEEGFNLLAQTVEQLALAMNEIAEIIR